MTTGVTNAGFVPLRLADIRAEMRALLIETFGAETDVSDDSVFSQITDITSTPAARLWEQALAVYNAGDPDLAFGRALENIAKLAGLSRRQATFSVGTLRFSGTPGVTIPLGTVVRSPALDRLVATTDAAIIGAGGFVDVAASALDSGPVAFGAGVLNQLVNAISGVSAVTNQAAFIEGRNEETDEELRARRTGSLQVVGSGNDRAIAGRIRQVEGVLQAFAFSNRGDTTDGFGFPPKSVNVVVWPSSLDADYRAAIATTLDRHSPAGIGFSGDIELDVTDEFGYTQTVAFRFAQAVNIYFQVDLTFDADYPVDGADQVKQALRDYTNSLQVGNDVRPVNLYAAISEIAGIVDVFITLKAGSAPGPVDAATIAISVLQIARGDVANIVVNETSV